ncbi:MAG: DUF2478 domain-containing protein [Rhodobiaceae bacterium]|nr:DUF2478 domain-containing protein [Rhodobiaceae bacterium]
MSDHRNCNAATTPATALQDNANTPETAWRWRVSSFKGNNPDAVFRAVANAFAERGIPLAGLVQETQADVPPDCCPPMLVRDVAGKRQMIISEDRGRIARLSPRLGRIGIRHRASRNCPAKRCTPAAGQPFRQGGSAGQGLRSAIELAIAEGIPSSPAFARTTRKTGQPSMADWQPPCPLTRTQFWPGWTKTHFPELSRIRHMTSRPAACMIGLCGAANRIA